MKGMPIWATLPRTEMFAPLSENGRKIIAASLLFFAEQLKAPFTLRRRFDSVLELYTLGYLRLETNPGMNEVRVIPCEPEEAPQLRRTTQ